MAESSLFYYCFYKRMSPIIACIAAVFSVAALAFYIVAGVGYYYRGRIFIQGCPWFYYQQTYQYYSDSIDIKYYFGLKGYYYKSDFGYNGFNNYGTSNDDYYDDDGSLDKCDSSGKSAFVLTVMACIFSFTTIITNGIGGVKRQ